MVAKLHWYHSDMRPACRVSVLWLYSVQLFWLFQPVRCFNWFWNACRQSLDSHATPMILSTRTWRKDAVAAIWNERERRKEQVTSAKLIRFATQLPVVRIRSIVAYWLAFRHPPPQQYHTDSRLSTTAGSGPKAKKKKVNSDIFHFLISV